MPRITIDEESIFVNEMYESRTAVDKAFDALIGREIQQLNNHLPKQRKCLKNLLVQDDNTAIEVLSTGRSFS